MKLNLKNKQEREQFLNAYTQWEEWKTIPELGLTFYRWQFENGDTFIVTEYQLPITKYNSLFVGQNYHLLLDKNSHDRAGSHIYHSEPFYTYYNPNGCSINTLIEYLTKNRDNLKSITSFREV